MQSSLVILVFHFHAEVGDKIKYIVTCKAVILCLGVGKVVRIQTAAAMKGSCDHRRKNKDG